MLLTDDGCVDYVGGPLLAFGNTRVRTQHRNRIGRLSPFSEYAPSASRFKSISFAAIKVTPYPDSVLNIARTEVPASPAMSA
jgi:hypothetical protein